MDFVKYSIFFFAVFCSSRSVAQDTVLKSNLDPQPVITVEEPKVVTVDPPKAADAPAGEKIPSVDTEAPSPIAPQSYDGFDGVAQEPFGPTQAERQAMRQERIEKEKKEQALAQQKLLLEQSKARQASKKALAAREALPLKSQKRLKVASNLRHASNKKPTGLKKLVVSQAAQPSSLRQPASNDKK
jgi:hypothetical protein